MSKEEVQAEKNWGLEVHGVLAPVAYETRSEAVKAIKEWQSRGWEFVNVRYLA
jgi:hypothetical protein